jgi:hypothetical protein
MDLLNINGGLILYFLFRAALAYLLAFLLYKYFKDKRPIKTIKKHLKK